MRDPSGKLVSIHIGDLLELAERLDDDRLVDRRQRVKMPVVDIDLSATSLDRHFGSRVIDQGPDQLVPVDQFPCLFLIEMLFRAFSALRRSQVLAIFLGQKINLEHPQITIPAFNDDVFVVIREEVPLDRVVSRLIFPNPSVGGVNDK